LSPLFQQFDLSNETFAPNSCQPSTDSVSTQAPPLPFGVRATCRRFSSSSTCRTKHSRPTAASPPQTPYLHRRRRYPLECVRLVAAFPAVRLVERNIRAQQLPALHRLRIYTGAAATLWSACDLSPLFQQFDLSNETFAPNSCQPSTDSVSTQAPPLPFGVRATCRRFSSSSTCRTKHSRPTAASPPQTPYLHSRRSYLWSACDLSPLFQQFDLSNETFVPNSCQPSTDSVSTQSSQLPRKAESLELQQPMDRVMILSSFFTVFFPHLSRIKNQSTYMHAIFLIREIYREKSTSKKTKNHHPSPGQRLWVAKKNIAVSNGGNSINSRWHLDTLVNV